MSPPTPKLPALCLAASLLLAALLPAQQSTPPDNALTRDIDPQLAALINSTLAIDNHAHPLLPPPANHPNQNPDRDFDALPVDNMEPQTDITAWTPANPQLPLAWRALWGFTAPAPLGPAGLDPAAMKQLEAARARVRTREGPHFDDWVLAQSGIATMLANRVAMAPASGQPALAPPHFLWVPYADALLFPFDTSALAAATPDRKLFFPLEDRLRARYLAALNLQSIPATLPAYLAKVVTPTLEHQQAAGAVAEKFELAYLRDFNISDPTPAQAAQIYASYQASPNPSPNPSPSPANYRILQDFLFRYIASECGRLHLAVHLHTMSGGGGFFSIAGANPLLLEPLFNDPRLRRTSFVLLHGGWPFVREAGALLQKPNVFLDLSQQSLSFPPRTLATWLREWLETFPDKVLFGTDGYPFTDSLGWEEATWIAAHNARQALALALTGMLRDGEITHPQASALALKVLRNNAASLYTLP